MKTVNIARRLVAIVFVVGTALTATACANDRPAGADHVQAAGVAQAQPTGADHVMLGPADVKWADASALPPGAKVSLIEGQLDQPVPFTLRLQLPADYQIPAHRHPVLEHVTVLSGVVNSGMGDTVDKAASTALPAGSFMVMPADSNHFMWTAEAAVIQVHGVGPFGITYVNPADDPRTT